MLHLTDGNLHFLNEHLNRLDRLADNQQEALENLSIEVQVLEDGIWDWQDKESDLDTAINIAKEYKADGYPVRLVTHNDILEI